MYIYILNGCGGENPKIDKLQIMILDIHDALKHWKFVNFSPNAVDLGRSKAISLLKHRFLKSLNHHFGECLPLRKNEHLPTKFVVFRNIYKSYVY